MGGDPKYKIDFNEGFLGTNLLPPELRQSDSAIGGAVKGEQGYQKSGADTALAAMNKDAQAKQLDRQNQAALRGQQENQAYQNEQNALTQSTADEDAFTAARNAARRAKGNTLYQGWG